MKNLVLVLIGLSAISFVFAVIAVILGEGYFFGTLGAEGLSRTCTNIALIAIAIALWHNMSEKK